MKLDKVLILSGDGIGPSVTKSAERVLAHFDCVEICHGEIGRSAYEHTGSYLPRETIDLLDDCKIIISGPVNVPEGTKNPLQVIKIQLDLFGRGRIYHTMSPDLGIEGMDVTLWSSYNNIASEIVEVKDFDGITISKYIKNDSYGRMMEIAHSDIDARGLSKILCLTRKDFFPISSGMFEEAFDTILSSDKYDTDKLNVKDWMSCVFREPKRYGCIICVDLYNQIVAGVLSGLTGNENLFPTVYRGYDYSLYEPNFATSIKGFEAGYENPTSAIITAALVLKKVGKLEEADRVMDALCDAYGAGKRTPDVGGNLSTEAFTDEVISRIK